MLRLLPVWRSSTITKSAINSSLQFSTFRRANSINLQLLTSKSLNRTPLWNQNNYRCYSISTYASNLCLSISNSISAIITNLYLKISNSTAVAYFQQGLIDVHDITGLPWWATIILSTVVLRTCITLPLATYQKIIIAKIELIKTMEMPNIINQLKIEAAHAKHLYKWSNAQTLNVFNRSVKKQYTALIVRDNCHPAKTLLCFWFQMPLWIIQSVALRNLSNVMPNPHALEAKLAYSQLTMGGFGWIPNLIEVDASYILPVMLGIFNLAVIEIQVMSTVSTPSKPIKYLTHFFRLLTVAMVPIAASVPSGLALYWTTSSAFGLVQNLLLISPKFKAIAGVPKTPSQLNEPYKHLANMTKERWNNFTKYFSFNK